MISCFWRMQILFTISVVSFLILALAGVAIVRSVRASHRRSKAASSPLQHPFSQHLFDAVKARDLGLPQAVHQQSIKDITANKAWNSPSALVEIPPVDGQLAMIGRRKSPQSERHVAEERLDWAYFNKDYGDLSDPYPSRPVRARAGAKSTFMRRS